MLCSVCWQYSITLLKLLENDLEKLDPGLLVELCFYSLWAIEYILLWKLCRFLFPIGQGKQSYDSLARSWEPPCSSLLGMSHQKQMSKMFLMLIKHFLNWRT